jgi:uncharacterized protein YlxW (UPF0749 family)
MKKKTQLLGTFLIMSMALTYGICMQMKTVNQNGSTVNLTAQQSELKSEILKISERYDNLYEEVDKLEGELERERESSASNNSNLAILEESIKEKNLALGLTEVTGTGIKIILNDGNTLTANPLVNVSDLLVHDGDLMRVVNELFNAGAEAISINGQRIITTTAIECDGNVVKINGNKIGAPFEITAIGYPEQLAGVARPGGTIEMLESRGLIVSLTKQNSVKIPKYAGNIKFNYAADAEND